ncbi:MAG: hypothetical protein Q8O75_00735, partial [bacterium]|nr:hypothetical protein [bacterium]
MPDKKVLPSKKLLIPIIIGIVAIGLVAVAGFYFWTHRTPPDNKKPELHLTNLAPDQWLSTNEDKVTVNGIAVDESEVKSINWENQNGKSGSATISGGQWSIKDVPLTKGD